MTLTTRSKTTAAARRHGMVRVGARVLVLTLGAAAGAWGVSTATAQTCVSPFMGTFIEARRDGEAVALPRTLEQWDDELYMTPYDSGNGRLAVDADPPIVLQLRGL